MTLYWSGLESDSPSVSAYTSPSVTTIWPSHSSRHVSMKSRKPSNSLGKQNDSIVSFVHSGSRLQVTSNSVAIGSSGGPWAKELCDKSGTANTKVINIRKDNRKKSTWTISEDGKITCKGNCTYIARVNTSKYGSQPSYEFINFGRPAAWEKNSKKISLIWSEGYIEDFECIIDSGPCNNGNSTTGCGLTP